MGISRMTAIAGFIIWPSKITFLTVIAKINGVDSLKIIYSLKFIW